MINQLKAGVMGLKVTRTGAPPEVLKACLEVCD